MRNRLLVVFGAAVLVFMGVTAAPLFAADEVRIATGDKIYVAIADQNQTFTVPPNGSIFLKGLGEVEVRGLAPLTVKQTISQLLSAHGLADLPVGIHLVAHVEEKPKVMLFGAVRREGTFEARTLLELLAIAGGAEPDVTEITVRDTTGMSLAFNIRQLLDGTEPDFEFLGGEMVIVRDRSPRSVSVYGEVNKPGPGRASTVLEAIGGAFGLKPTAAAERIQISLPDGTTSLFDYQAAALGAANDEPLDEGAVIFVPAKATVLVSGGVARPGWVYASTVIEALEASGWMLPDAIPESAVIKSSRGETESVDLRILLEDPDADFILEPSDELVIPSRSLPAVDSKLAIDSGVLVIGFGVRTTVLPPGDLREALVAAGYAPGRSNITTRVYRKGATLTLDLDRIIHGKERFETRAGDSVYVEPKTDPIAFILRLLGFGRTVTGTVGQFE